MPSHFGLCSPLTRALSSLRSLTAGLEAVDSYFILVNFGCANEPRVQWVIGSMDLVDLRRVENDW